MDEDMTDRELIATFEALCLVAAHSRIEDAARDAVEARLPEEARRCRILDAGYLAVNRTIAGLLFSPSNVPDPACHQAVHVRLSEKMTSSVRLANSGECRLKCWDWLCKVFNERPTEVTELFVPAIVRLLKDAEIIRSDLRYLSSAKRWSPRLAALVTAAR